MVKGVCELFEFNKKYGFHDTAITNILLSDKKLSMFFPNGVYLLDEKGKESVLTKRCRVDFLFNSYSDSAEDNVSIWFFGKRKEISIDRFRKRLGKEKFEILFDYYSPFARSVLFKGYVGKISVDFIVDDISAVNFVFDD